MIRPFESADRDALIALWRDCDLTRPWNDPNRDIDRKLAVDPGGLLVGVDNGVVIGSVMVGYDGHRGWVNYLAVSASQHRRGLGRKLMDAAEEYLLDRGCPKLNLQIRAANDAAIGFYESLGYATDDVVSMGKRLIADD